MRQKFEEGSELSAKCYYVFSHSAHRFGHRCTSKISSLKLWSHHLPKFQDAPLAQSQSFEWPLPAYLRRFVQRSQCHHQSGQVEKSGTIWNVPEFFALHLHPAVANCNLDRLFHLTQIRFAIHLQAYSHVHKIPLIDDHDVSVLLLSRNPRPGKPQRLQNSVAPILPLTLAASTRMLWKHYSLGASSSLNTSYNSEGSGTTAMNLQ